MLDTLVRAFRGTVRSPGRTVLIVLLLAAGLGFALTSLALAFAAGDELDKIKQTVGVEAAVSINPGQFQSAIQAEIDRVASTGDAFDSNRVGQAIEPLSQEHADRIGELPYVRRVEVFTIAAVEYGFSDRESARENDLQTPLGPVSLPDAIVTGTRDSSFLVDFQLGVKRLEEGRLFTPEDDGRNVVVIDQDTATFEELQVGDSIILMAPILPEEGEEPPAEPQFREVEAEIIGIFSDLQAAATGGFSPARIEAWYAPFSLVRQLQAPDTDALSAISIVYDSIDNVDRLEADLTGFLDAELYTLTTTRERFEQISGPVETMRTTGVVVTAVGLGVVGLIMLLLMALVIRGRLREIGILKAVGARNRHVIGQFAAETVGVAVVAVVISVPLVLAINSFLPDLLRPSAEVQQEAQTGMQTGPNLGAGARALTSPPVQDDPVRTEEVESVLQQVNASVSPEIVAVAAAIAVGLGLLGALVPIVAVLRLRPAEVLRLEA